MSPARHPTWPPAGEDLDSLGALEREVANLREQAFALSDSARRVLGVGMPDAHVHLQTAANELGELEKILARQSAR